MADLRINGLSILGSPEFFFSSGRAIKPKKGVKTAVSSVKKVLKLNQKDLTPTVFSMSLN